MTKLYVGNLPFTATEEAVRNLFAPHGTVEKLSLINARDSRPLLAYSLPPLTEIRV